MTMQSNGSPATSSPRAITIAILAMGGEGGGVLADWIVDVGEHCGYIAQTTSVPGVAQRTGSTIYYIELFPEKPAQAAGKDPVLALMPVPGEVDIVLASELMEAARAVQRGLVTSERTTLIASTNRVYSMTEKTAVADGQVDASKLFETCRAAAQRFVAADFARLAEEKRSAISAALLGALFGTGALPFPQQEFEQAIHRSGVGVDASLTAFAAGIDAAQRSPQWNPDKPMATIRKPGARLHRLAKRIEESFSPAAHEVLFAGIERLTDYQDEDYAANYLSRLEPVRDLDAEHGDHEFSLLRETARYLALWMSYEDAARVADLKTRRARFDRVRNESRAQAAQLVQINEFIYPRMQEIADIMPAAIGRWLLTSRTAQGVAARFMQHGRTMQTTSLSGFLQLYFMAEFRRWRRRSLRFQEEQGRIEQWLEKLKEFAREDYAAAEQIAEFPRVVKGYGDTHTNGRRKFDLLMRSLDCFRSRIDAASILRNLIDSALADENGAKLDETLGTILELKSTQTEQTSTIPGIEPASPVTPMRIEGHGR
jgi:indolepyruvate ferredoxin oxidoreductase beta subunit